jgi:alkylhydroperoxidase/carboxymuconolactone decarboxylase family protein YurZ
MSNAGRLEEAEKLQVALSAAMGAGCRSCADKLYPMLQSLGVAADEIEQALVQGLRARGAAAALMRAKAEALTGQAPPPESAGRDEAASVLSELMRIGAGVAANSAPSTLHHMERARAAGATEQEIRTAIGTARLVRSKAQEFSDAEIDEACAAAKPDARVPEVPCPLNALGDSGARSEPGCCS